MQDGNAVKVFLRKQQWDRRERGFFLGAVFCLACFASIGVGLADEWEENIAWTESVSSKDGQFALSLDSQSKRAVVYRSDDRNLGQLQLRLRILRANQPALELGLRRFDNGETPWKYGAHAESWDGQCVGMELESSVDGKAWKAVGKFRKP